MTAAAILIVKLNSSKTHPVQDSAFISQNYVNEMIIVENPEAMYRKRLDWHKLGYGDTF
mgnify:CR=1 FL=1